MPLASANSADTSNTLAIMLVCLAILAAAALLAVLPILLARRRNHRFAEPLTAASLLWAAGAAASAITTYLAQSQYSARHDINMMSGYLNPNDLTDKPPYPWLTWLALLAGYILLTTLAAIGKKNAPPTKDPP